MGKNIFSLVKFTTYLICTFLLFSLSSNSKAVTITEDLDPETTLWLQRVSAAGGSVSDSIVSAIDDYIKEIKGLKYQSLNIRDRIFRENWFCGNFNAAFVPIIINPTGSPLAMGNPTDVNRNFTSSNYKDTGKYSGLKGNGVNQYIETGFTPSLINEFPLNDVYFLFYCLTDSVDNGRSGSRGTSGSGFYAYPKFVTGNSHFVLNSNTGGVVVFQSIKGYTLHQRSNSQEIKSYYSLNQVGTSQVVTTSKPDKQIYICAFNNNGVTDTYSTTRYGGYSFGKSFSEQARVVHFNAVQRLMSRLGRKLPESIQTDLKSKLMTFTGKNLIVNYETRNNGNIKFGLSDINGNVISGYSVDNCLPLTGNEFTKTVSWNSGNDLSSFVNTPLYLNIRMTDADLYSIQFQNQIVQTDSSKQGFKIGTYKQFFADTLFIGSFPSVMRKMHNPVKDPQPVVRPEQEWEENRLFTTYSNVTYSKSIEQNRMVFKMWLRAVTGTYRLPVYYESVDGVNWTRPVLEQFKFNNSMENNIMSDAPYPGGLYTVVDDSLYNQSDSTRRYKSMFNTHSNGLSYLNVSFSYDGITWIPYADNPVGYMGEDLTSGGWNPVIGKYLGYFRDSLGIRNVSRYVSNDWINWTKTGKVLVPDANDQAVTGYYNLHVLFKDSVYWGFLGHLQLNSNGDENPPNPSRTDNTVHIELVFSRDGINFTRCGNRMPFLDIGPLAAWDDQCVYSIGVPIVVGNEYYYYYNGFNTKHMWTAPPPANGQPKTAQVGLAKIGLDRFISLSTY